VHHLEGAPVHARNQMSLVDLEVGWREGQRFDRSIDDCSRMFAWAGIDRIPGSPVDLVEEIHLVETQAVVVETVGVEIDLGVGSRVEGLAVVDGSIDRNSDIVGLVWVVDQLFPEVGGP